MTLQELFAANRAHLARPRKSVAVEARGEIALKLAFAEAAPGRLRALGS
jgi:hypothetical protein